MHVESMKNPYATIAKPDLEALKAGYLKDLANPRISPVMRGTIQTELSLINAAIRSINVAEAARAKAEADQKRAAGLAEFQACTARAIGAHDPRSDLHAATGTTGMGGAHNPRSDLHAATERPGTNAPKSSRGSLPAAPPQMALSPANMGKPPWPKGVHSRGEFILMRAEQLQSQIKKLVCEPLSHTRSFLPQLDAFIKEQRVIVAAEKIERRAAEKDLRSSLPAATRGRGVSSGPADWVETWKDGDNASPIASAWPKGWPRTAQGDAPTPCPVCGPEREVCFIKSDGLRCVVAGQMGPSRWHPTSDSTSTSP